LADKTATQSPSALARSAEWLEWLEPPGPAFLGARLFRRAGGCRTPTLAIGRHVHHVHVLAAACAHGPGAGWAGGHRAEAYHSYTLSAALKINNIYLADGPATDCLPAAACCFFDFACFYVMSNWHRGRAERSSGGCQFYLCFETWKQEQMAEKRSQSSQINAEVL